MSDLRILSIRAAIEIDRKIRGQAHSDQAIDEFLSALKLWSPYQDEDSNTGRRNLRNLDGIAAALTEIDIKVKSIDELNYSLQRLFAIQMDNEPERADLERLRDFCLAVNRFVLSERRTAQEGRQRPRQYEILG